MADNDAVGEGEGPPELCDWCGRTWRDGVLALVPDSSAVHTSDPDKDGKRLIVACPAEHLAELQEEYRQRSFVSEELWAWQIVRALTSATPGTTAKLLAHMAGLTIPQIVQAIAGRNEPFLHLRNPPKDEPP